MAYFANLPSSNDNEAVTIANLAADYASLCGATEKKAR
jgi:hypothetical protein